MSLATRSLDDVDRLAFRLSRTVRTYYPQLLTQGFTLTDLEERLLPFREVRREMANGGAAAFETAVLRLLAGERGYLVSDPELQAACRDALDFPSPALAMVRSWASATLRLVQQEQTEQPSDGSTRNESVAEPGACCRFCAGRLPEGRKVTFCPHCGVDLTKRQCAACSTELEAHWRFCVTCGRSG
jgi:hypothetical protein